MDNVGMVVFKLPAGVFCGFDNHMYRQKKTYVRDTVLVVVVL